MKENVVTKWNAFYYYLGMPSNIRKAKTASDATAVQIVQKEGRKVTGIKHIGPDLTK